MNLYRISGLSVASELVLPGVLPGEPNEAPEIIIRRGVVPEHLAAGTASGPTWQIAGADFLLHVPGVARFLLSRGTQIVFDPETEHALDHIPVFILGTVFGILLHQRGQIVLHASAVRVGGLAVLFCGASGAGKSTLAAALASRGYPLVTDDVCTVAIEDGVAPVIFPDGRQLKLWAQAIDRLDLASERGERVRPNLEKFYIAPAAAFTEPLPLAAVYVLQEARLPYQPGIEKPNVVDASLLLRRNAYRPMLVRRLAQRDRYFRAAAAIANAAGIYYLTRPLGFDKMVDAIAMLESHWRALHLGGVAA